MNLLRGRGAHVDFEKVVEEFPAKLRGKKPPGAPHTAWQLLEHLRIAQWDILEFSRNAKHVSPDFPEGYWPKEEAPPDGAAWDKSLKAFRDDLKEMEKLSGSDLKRLVLDPNVRQNVKLKARQMASRR